METRVLFIGIYLILETIAVILIIALNLVVVYVMIYKKQLKKPSHSFIVSVAFADLLIGFVAVPEAMLVNTETAPQDYNFCLIATVISFSIYFISLTTLAAVSADRFWAICYPVHYRTFNSFRINVAMNCFSWIVGICLGASTFFENIPEENYNQKCTFTNIMSIRGTFIFSLTTVIVCSMTIVTYFFIFREIRKMSVLKKVLRSGQKSQKNSEVKFAKTFSLIIGTYIIFWAPLTIHCIVIYFSGKEDFFYKNWTLRIIKIFCVCFAHFNSVLNPLIYAYQIKDVRDAIKKLLGMHSEASPETIPARTTTLTSGHSFCLKNNLEMTDQIIAR